MSARLLEVGVDLVDVEQEELLGIQSESRRGRCVIDLRRVVCVYESPEDFLCIELDSGESVVTDMYDIDTFVSIWGSDEG